MVITFLFNNNTFNLISKNKGLVHVSVYQNVHEKFIIRITPEYSIFRNSFFSRDLWRCSVHSRTRVRVGCVDSLRWYYSRPITFVHNGQQIRRTRKRKVFYVYANVAPHNFLVFFICFYF